MFNYRPISVISIVARIMKKLIHNQIYEYLIEAFMKRNFFQNFLDCLGQDRRMQMDIGGGGGGGWQQWKPREV